MFSSFQSTSTQWACGTFLWCPSTFAGQLEQLASCNILILGSKIKAQEYMTGFFLMIMLRGKPLLAGSWKLSFERRWKLFPPKSRHSRPHGPTDNHFSLSWLDPMLSPSIYLVTCACATSFHRPHERVQVSYFQCPLFLCFFSINSIQDHLSRRAILGLVRLSVQRFSICWPSLLWPVSLYGATR